MCDNNKNVLRSPKSHAIKVKLKFVKSEISDTMCAFVNKNPETHRWSGVRADSDCLKRICLPIAEIKNTILPKVLYDAEMVEMVSKDGFVVTSVTPVLFKAVVTSTVIKNTIYKVEVRFGQKTIVYDPLEGHKKNMSTIEGVLEIMRSRQDIKDYNIVEEEFLKMANLVKGAYEYDGHCETKN